MFSLWEDNSTYSKLNKFILMLNGKSNKSSSIIIAFGDNWGHFYYACYINELFKKYSSSFSLNYLYSYV